MDATARDNQSTQDNEKHDRGDYRPPIIFGTPWVGPPTVVHIDAHRLIVHKPRLSALLCLELPDECSEVRGDGSRKGVVLILEALSNC